MMQSVSAISIVFHALHLIKQWNTIALDIVQNNACAFSHPANNGKYSLTTFGEIYHGFGYFFTARSKRYLLNNQ
ncbi:MAG: hypothetical protein ABIN67_24315 [Ferruginibacter sp.]